MLEVKKRLNVKDLTTESPTAGASLSFDFEKEISAEDREEMKYFLEVQFDKYRKKPSKDAIDAFTLPAFDMSILDPQLLSGIDFVEDDYDRFLAASYDNVIFEHTKQLGCVKQLFPKEQIPITYSQVEMNFDLYKISGVNGHLIENAIPLYYVLFPQEIKKLSDDKALYEVMTDRIIKFGNEGDGDSLLQAETARNIIYGQEPTLLTKSQLQNYSDGARILKGIGDWPAFASRAVQLKLNGAKEVKMTEDGLRLRMSKSTVPFAQAQTRVPERRKF